MARLERLPPPVAFYAPIKPPDHPTPSGDREVARLLLSALRCAGFAPHLASRLSTLDLVGNGERALRLDARAGEEVARLVARYGAVPAERPRAWFTYHLHYKAPDLLGPKVAARLAIPYFVAEGSRAPKRAGGAWAEGHRQAEAALDRADTIFVMNPADRPMLERARSAGQRLVDLPPFLDPAGWPDLDGGVQREDGGPLRLLAVAMMRDGDKLASYRLLADALARLEPGSWTLDIVGDGRARPAVEALFGPFARAVTMHGLVQDRPALAALYAAAALFVWPAVNEAFGMVFLEAALQGLPALAGDFGGVGDMVADGRTGMLTPPGDAAAFADAIGGLARDRDRLARLAAAARRFVLEERSIDAAATLLRREIAPLLRETADP